MLTAEKYATQFLAVVENYMKSSDVFHAELGIVKVPWNTFAKMCSIIDQKVTSCGYPWHNVNTGDGWTFWNERAQVSGYRPPAAQQRAQAPKM